MGLGSGLGLGLGLGLTCGSSQSAGTGTVTATPPSMATKLPPGDTPSGMSTVYWRGGVNAGPSTMSWSGSRPEDAEVVAGADRLLSARQRACTTPLDPPAAPPAPAAPPEATGATDVNVFGAERSVNSRQSRACCAPAVGAAPMWLVGAAEAGWLSAAAIHAWRGGKGSAVTLRLRSVASRCTAANERLCWSDANLVRVRVRVGVRVRVRMRVMVRVGKGEGEG